MKLIELTEILILLLGATEGYFADWSMLTRDRIPSCVSIPKNLSLCHNIGYNRMRLPNLLEHDTMHEVSHHANSWVPLLTTKCHSDTQLFLCSLFAPVCLERTIYPCRSLCLKVKNGCESTMKSHGFPWPSMLDCDKFPLDNDMCISSRNGAGHSNGAKNHPSNYREIVSDIVVDEEEEEQKEERRLVDVQSAEKEASCSSQTCTESESYDSLLQHFCEADFVVKIKFKKIKGRLLFGRKVKTFFKTPSRSSPKEGRRLRKPKLKLRRHDECCSSWIKNRRKRQAYLLMGSKQGDVLVPHLIYPWTKDRGLKRARRAFKQLDCSSFSSSSVEYDKKRESNTRRVSTKS